MSVTHDHKSFVNQVLGKKSPIVDIEHLQLFSKKSIVELLQRSNFNSIGEFSFFNRYSLRYWVRLFPFPKNLKRQILRALVFTRLGNVKIALNVGNTMAWGQKPFQHESK